MCCVQLVNWPNYAAAFRSYLGRVATKWFATPPIPCFTPLRASPRGRTISCGSALLLPRTTWVYTRNISGLPARDAKELAQLRIGVVREEAALQDLQAAGSPHRVRLVEESSNDAVFRMLMGDMVQAMVDTEVGMAWNLRSVGRPAGSVTKLLKLSDDGGYYFALNKQSHPLLAIKLQQAVDKLRSEGRLDAIVRNYEPGP